MKPLVVIYCSSEEYSLSPHSCTVVQSQGLCRLSPCMQVSVDYPYLSTQKTENTAQLGKYIKPSLACKHKLRNDPRYDKMLFDSNMARPKMIKLISLCNKVKRKVQGIPQSQTAANPRHQEEEKKDKNIHTQNKQTNVREAQRPATSFPSEVIRMLKQTEKRGHRERED